MCRSLYHWSSRFLRFTGEDCLKNSSDMKVLDGFSSTKFGNQVWKSALESVFVLAPKVFDKSAKAGLCYLLAKARARLLPGFSCFRSGNLCFLEHTLFVAMIWGRAGAPPIISPHVFVNYFVGDPCFRIRLRVYSVDLFRRCMIPYMGCWTRSQD